MIRFALLIWFLNITSAFPAVTLVTSAQISGGDIDALDGLQKLSMAMWANVTAPAGSSVLASDMGTAGLNGWAVEVTATTVQLSFRTNTYVTGSYTYPNFGVMTHLAFVYDGSQSTDATKTKLYVNGTSVTLTFSGGSQPTNLTGNGNALIIGTNSNLAGGVACTIDDFAIWGGVALTDAQIQLIYQSKTRFIPIQLLATLYWPLDVGAGGASLTGSTFPDMIAARNGTGAGTLTAVSGFLLTYP